MSGPARNHFRAIMAIYPAAFVVLLGFGALRLGIGDWAWLLWLAAGLLLWTLIEYGMHRFVFHYWAPKVRPRQVPPHLRHHETPREAEFILTPISFSLPMAAVVAGGLRLALGSWERAATVIAGVIAGYLAYEILHLRMHTSSSSGALIQWMRRHHFRHHFIDPDACFGVTTPLWDVVLRTFPQRDPSGAYRGPTSGRGS